MCLVQHLQVGKFDGNVFQGFPLEIVVVTIVTFRFQREGSRGHYVREIMVILKSLTSQIPVSNIQSVVNWM